MATDEGNANWGLEICEILYQRASQSIAIAIATTDLWYILFYDYAHLLMIERVKIGKEQFISEH